MGKAMGKVTDQATCRATGKARRHGRYGNCFGSEWPRLHKSATVFWEYSQNIGHVGVTAMWIKTSTAALLVLTTTVAFAASADYQIVKVASVAGATIDTLKPKTIFFTDHRTDEGSDKGAFIRFGDWSRDRPVEYKFLNI